MGDVKDSGKANPKYMEMFEELTDANKTKEEITAAYDKWSNYEEIILAYAPNRPFIGAKAFEAQYNGNKDIKILDAGAGSGLASAEALHQKEKAFVEALPVLVFEYLQLVKLGYHDIDALEPCETLAKQALEKNIYKKWFKAYMCKDRLPIDDDVYDVIYSVGVFSKGQAREDCLEELIRVLKPGGQIMIITGEGYLKHPYMASFEPRIAELEKEGILICRKRDLVPKYSADETGPMNGLVLVLEKPKC